MFQKTSLLLFLFALSFHIPPLTMEKENRTYVHMHHLT